MIIGWILRHCGTPRVGQAFTYVSALIFFIIWATLASLISFWTPSAQTSLLMQVRLLVAILIMLTLSNTVQQLRILLWCLVLASGFIAYELNMSYLAGFNRLQYVGFAGMDNNFFAVGMVVGTVLSFFTGLSEKNILLKGLAFLFALFQAHAIMFSMSRGGMLGLCVAACATFYVLPKTQANISIFLLAICVGGYLAGPSVRERFSSAFTEVDSLDSSAQSRLNAWDACIDTIRQKPVFGIGITNWTNYYKQSSGIYLEAHSTWLQTCVECGIPALLAQLIFFLGLLRKMHQVLCKKLQHPDPRINIYAQMVFVAIAGYGVSAQFVSLYGLEIIYYTGALGMIILKLIHLHQIEEEEKERLRMDALAHGWESEEDEQDYDEQQVGSPQWA
ncbi:MAG: O-antigen ligase family protein [Planctomycetia bacterium]|nr:O-antigen ligase family protein [Planctomycetia bacterium]